MALSPVWAVELEINRKGIAKNQLTSILTGGQQKSILIEDKELFFSIPYMDPLLLSLFIAVAVSSQRKRLGQRQLFW